MTFLNLLSSPDWRERRQAIEALAKMDDASLENAILEILRAHHQDLSALNAALQLLCMMEVPVTSGLLTLLENPDPDTRTYAALALGELEDEGAIPGLMKALDDPNLNVRFNAIEALGKLRASAAVEKLLDLLRSRDFYLAFPALQSLAKIGDPRPAPDLVELLQDELLSIAAAQALGELGSMEQAAAIIAWMETSPGDVPTAVTALTTLGRRHGLTGEEDSDASKPVASISGQARQALVHQIAEPFNPSGRARLLSMIPPNGIESGSIARGANPSQPGVELAASQDLLLTNLAYLLGWLLEDQPEDIEIVNALAGLLSFHPARQAAAKALVHAEAIPALISALDAEDHELVTLAVDALGKTGDPEPFDALIFEALISKIGHPSARVRRAITNAFSSRRCAQYTKRFLDLLSDSNPAVREAALRCLANPSTGEDADEKITAFLAALKDPSPTVRKAAVEALPYLESQQAFQALAEVSVDEDAGLRAAAARSFARIDSDQALPYLHRALSDTDPWVRLYACRSLAQHAKPESISYIVHLINDPSPPMRIAVAEVLGHINTAQALAYLQTLLEDPEIEVRQAAEKALGGSLAPPS